MQKVLISMCQAKMKKNNRNNEYVDAWELLHFLAALRTLGHLSTQSQ